MIKISEIVTNQIVNEAKLREDEHVSSGKLSASNLGNPLQWQEIAKYNNYPEWSKLNSSQLASKARELYK